MRGPGRLLLKRALSEPMLLLAAFGSILLATTTLVALAMYTSSITEAGVRRAMETAPFTTRAAVITAPAYRNVDEIVRAQVREAYGGVPVQVDAITTSGTYVVPGQATRKTPDLMVFGIREDLQHHARLISGTWPGKGETAVSQPVAAALHLATGQTITTESRLDHRGVTIRVSGVFQLDDPFGDRWFTEPLLRKGSETGNYTTYGPLIVSRDTFLARFTGGMSASWLAVPDLRGLSPERLRPLSAGVTSLQERLVKAGCARCGASSGLPATLAQLAVAALVARSTMLIPVLQLLLLAAYALILTARLLADHRRMEVALLRARGAGGARLAWLAGGEALLVAAPCAIIAPLLAPLMLALVSALPWIKASGVRPAPVADAGSFALSVGVAIASALLLALPALTGARRTYVEQQTSRGGRSLVTRAGADLLLLAVAALAAWQLLHYGGPVTATASGGLGIDPLIVSGPALALLSGGLLCLRLVPPLANAAVRFTSRRPTLAPALGAWQVSRRPLRYAGPALLLTMAVAIGGVSLATTSTWRASQDDQASHQAGADLRISDPPDNLALGPFGRGGTYAALPGVTSISPAFRGTAELDGQDTTVLALDASKLDGLMRLREDLSADSVAAMAARMRADRPRTALVVLPKRLDITLDVERAALAPLYAVPVTLTLVDRIGVWHDLLLGTLRPGANHFSVDPAALAGREGRLSGPLSLRGIAFDVAAPAQGSALSVRVDGVELPAGTGWAHRFQRPGKIKGERVTEHPGGFTLRVTAPEPSFKRDAAQRIALRPEPAHAPTATAPVPAVLTRGLATRLQASVGQVTSVVMESIPLKIKVAGIVDVLPATPAERPAVLLDLPSLQQRQSVAALPPEPTTEWWAATADGATAGAVALLRQRPQWNAVTVDLPGLTERLRDDPLAGGLQGALVLGFVAALLFAALGFVVNAAVAARERGAEFAILRALGVSFRQVFGLLAVEQAFIVGLSLASGTGLAIAVGLLVVPRIVLTGQASAVTPGVRFELPWPATGSMLALVAVLLFGIVAALAARLRGRGFGRLMRIGEDR